MLARVFEAHGLTTVQVGLVREHLEKVKPPRALWVPFNFGQAFGAPNDAAQQHRVLAAALALLDRSSGPVLEGFPEEGEAILVPPSRAAATAKEPDVATEVFNLRGYYTQYVERHGSTTVGLAKVPATRFRGLVRLLEDYAEGKDVAPAERPEGTRLTQYVRYAVDDLKAFYWEARLVQQPNASYQEITDWFWLDTLAAGLIRRVKARMTADGDGLDKAIAFGLVPAVV